MKSYLVWSLILPVAGVFGGAWAFAMNRKHLLNMLISLEFMVLSLYWLMCSILGACGSGQYFVLFFLSLGVCEGALGLSLLVSIVRGYGSDKFASFSLSQC